MIAEKLKKDNFESENDGAMFNKYKRADGKSRVLLLYLILNNYNLDKVENLCPDCMRGLLMKCSPLEEDLNCFDTV